MRSRISQASREALRNKEWFANRFGLWYSLEVVYGKKRTD